LAPHKLNSTFFERFLLDDEPLRVATDQIKPPFDEIREAVETYQAYQELALGRQARQPRVRNAVRLPGREQNQTLVLADIFPVSVSSKRVLVEVMPPDTNRGLIVAGCWLELGRRNRPG
jgi:hypothetical protein